MPPWPNAAPNAAAAPSDTQMSGRSGHSSSQRGARTRTCRGRGRHNLFRGRTWQKLFLPPHALGTKAIPPHPRGNLGSSVDGCGRNPVDDFGFDRLCHSIPCATPNFREGVCTALGSGVDGWTVADTEGRNKSRRRIVTVEE